MSRKTEFLAKVKPILDKSDVKKDAEEYAKELQDVIKDVKFGFDEDSLKELGEALNEELVKKGKQPLVFSDIKIDDNVFKNVATRFAQAVSSGMAQGASSVDLKRAIADLSRRKDELEQANKVLDREEASLKKAYRLAYPLIQSGEDEDDRETRRQSGVKTNQKNFRSFVWNDRNNP